MKKILIFYGSYGGGHLSAANSIKEHLNESYPNIEVQLIDCIQYINKAINKISTTAYNEMAKKAPWAWGKIYSKSQSGPLAHFTTSSNKIMALKLKKLILQEKLFDIILDNVEAYGLGIVNEKVIDEINILNATMLYNVVRSLPLCRGSGLKCLR